MRNQDILGGDARQQPGEGIRNLERWKGLAKGLLNGPKEDSASEHVGEGV
jgi:hypothetical protein